MKTLLLLSILLGIAAAQKMVAMTDGHEEWETFKATHNKVYLDARDEYSHKMAFFRSRLFVGSHSDDSFQVDLNPLADRTPEEYRRLNGFRRTPRNQSRPLFRVSLDAEIPDSVDWREHGYVTEVKDQGDCGSCWAFSATGALEGQLKRASGRLVSLSEQNLVDCAGAFGTSGCNGASGVDGAFEYVRANGGIDTEESYPYTAKNGWCRFQRSAVGTVDVDVVDIAPGDEEQLKKAVATVGPVSVAIDANHASFRQYQGGVFFEPQCSSQELSHGVLIVGYGSDPKDGDYWIVKNSWGVGWGEKGYVRMARNRGNNCGIATTASYPVVPAEFVEAELRLDGCGLAVVGAFAAFLVCMLVLVICYASSEDRVEVLNAEGRKQKEGFVNRNFSV
ncbi:hypothetical protein QR680_011294 [Steinernema hermaphroditum]|uniref:Cathepsin L-like n=1 Tax=Steinernema hermaphroditum TaxID=289476 RepID=A0AA39MD40_9BILA|nr:hypothetical protein QR680_011294 [Steinernema hermaphroditum]